LNYLVLCMCNCNYLNNCNIWFTTGILIHSQYWWYLNRCVLGRFVARDHSFNLSSIHGASDVRVQLKQCILKLNRVPFQEMFEISREANLICTSTENDVIFLAKRTDNWIHRLDMYTGDTETHALAMGDMRRFSSRGDNVFIGYSPGIHCLNWSDKSVRVISDEHKSYVCCIADDRIVTHQHNANALAVIDVNALTEHATYTYEEGKFIPEITADDSRVCGLFYGTDGHCYRLTVFDHNLKVLRNISPDVLQLHRFVIVGDILITKTSSNDGVGNVVLSYHLETGDHLAQHRMTRPRGETRLKGIASTTAGKLLLLWSNGTLIHMNCPLELSLKY
jgi:hypothetical protein